MPPEEKVEVLQSCIELLKSNDTVTAVNTLEKYKAYLIQDPLYLELYSLACYRTGEFRKAIALAQRGCSIPERTGLFQEYYEKYSQASQALDNTIKETAALINNSDYLNVANRYKEFIYVYPDVISGYILYGLALCAAGKYKAAGIQFKTALSLDKNNTLIKSLLFESEKFRSKAKNALIFIASAVTVSACALLTVSLIEPSVFSPAYRDMQAQYSTLLSNYEVLDKEAVNDKNSIKELEAMNSELSDSLQEANKEIQELSRTTAPDSETTSNVVPVVSDGGNSGEAEKLREQLAAAVLPQELFNNALKYYKSGEYNNSFMRMDLVYRYSADSAVKAEALFFAARSLHNLAQTEDAAKLYEEYTTQYPQKNYYDDTLYYLTIIYDEQNNTERSRVFAEKLLTECPESVYCNSRIRKIAVK